MKLRQAALLLACWAVAATALAYDGLVEKKVFEMPSYTTVGGKTIQQVRVGYETWGKLNAAGDNAILICHYFSGSSHAAGKYAHEDAKPGYWDALIGSGKAIDTDKYFVVSADVLANLNKDTQKYTTGPASINPDTKKPYGMKFPIVTIRDFVNVQHALLQKLGVKKLVAVAGPSLGSMQALEWGSAYPDMVERVLAVIPAGVELDPLTVLRVGLWAQPIRLDPKWNNGDYYGREEPKAGLKAAIKESIVDVLHWGEIGSGFGRNWAMEDRNPIGSWYNYYSAEAAVDSLASASAETVDANSFLYLAKSAQLFRVGHGPSLDEGLKRIKAKVLIMPAASDVLFFPAFAKRAADSLKKNGVPLEYVEIEGTGGHMDGIQKIGQMNDRIREFLGK